MHLDTVVSILVGVFRIHTLGQWRKTVGQFGILLLFGTLFRRQLAFAGYVVQCLVNIHITRSLVQQRATCVQLGFHRGQHVIYGREVDDGLTELFTVFRVCQSLVVGRLTQPYRLCGDAEACTVHQCHDILYQTQLAASA